MMKASAKRCDEMKISGGTGEYEGDTCIHTDAYVLQPAEQRVPLAAALNVTLPGHTV